LALGADESGPIVGGRALDDDCHIGLGKDRGCLCSAQSNLFLHRAA
jgi:hypothetical protein